MRLFIRRPRRGFTLLEVMVAVGIAVLVVLGARLLLENLTRAMQQVSREARDADQEANGERLLRSLLNQVEVGFQKETFRGDEQSAQFTSWCQSPRGWLERCTVTMVIDTIGGAATLQTTLPNGDVLVLKRAHKLRLSYLVDAGNGGTWRVNWDESLLSPPAIGVIADSDTLIIRIGERS